MEYLSIIHIFRAYKITKNMSKDCLKKMKTELCDEVKYFLEINTSEGTINKKIALQ